MNGTEFGPSYVVCERLGKGSFGVVHRCSDTSDPARPLAVKLERRDAKAPQLRYEWRVYRHLQPHAGVPTAHFFGECGADHVALVMDLLGPPLEAVTELTMRQVLVVGVQLIELLKYLHGRGFIHRDIKPQNVMLGRAEGPHAAQLFLIDYGLCKKFVRSGPVRTHHVPYKEDKRLTGTPRFCSINTQIGLESSRRDDMEAVVYMMIYMAHRRLPWMGLRARGGKAKKTRLILKKKQATPVAELCRDMPASVGRMLRHVRQLRFKERPAYEQYTEDLLHDL